MQQQESPTITIPLDQATRLGILDLLAEDTPEEPEPEPAWLTAQEAAKRLNVSINTIYRMADSGLVRIMRIGPRGKRFAAADLDPATRVVE